VPRVEAAAEDPVGGVKKETARWKDRRKVRDLLADAGCSRAVLHLSPLRMRCPAHQGITGNEKADEWAKIAA